MLQAIAGYDPEDPTSVNAPVPDYSAALCEKARLRIGIPRAHFYDELDSEIEAAINAAVSRLGEIGTHLKDVDLPAANDTMVLRAEAYAYHLESIRKHAELYQPHTVRRIRSGEAITVVDYIRARRALEECRREIVTLFEKVDVLITPTTPVLPPTIAELLGDLDNLRGKEIAMLRNTRPFNALALPTISVPCGFSKKGVPIGMQITAAPWAEANALSLAHAYEQQTNWQAHHPEMN
jgi:Asp-tRNA(Asn)/Glu-tRNA(Gln) amidotransferase A subunit family amidase